MEKKRFHPLRHQITFLFIFFFSLSILIMTIINGVFLEKYYISKKMDVLINAKNHLQRLDIQEMMEYQSGNGDDTTKEFWNIQDELGKNSSRNNLSWVIINRENSAWCSWGENERLLSNKLFGYIYDLDRDKFEGHILKTTDTCVVQQVHDRFVGMDYVECWGTLNEEYFFLIRTPLETIKESAMISNTFYFFVGVIMVILSCIIVTIASRKITKPISELTVLSKKMSEQDFEVKYESNVGNEIDILGHSFNKMAQELEKTISELKSANNELTKDIENKIIQEKKQKEFLDNVSHELKTPIALIQGYAEGLKDNIIEDPESMEFYCDVIIDESQKMNKLVRNLLSLNQLESGKDAALMERFNITELITGVIQKMDIVIRQKEAWVNFDSSREKYVWGDEFKIEEVLTNYLSNALNHLSGDRQIEIKAEEQGDKYKISVFNTGAPIPENDLPNLWNKFYKVDKARTREYGGSGIGLSIVKAIMEGMHQEYGVQNFENGVEFWFTLDRK